MSLVQDSPGGEASGFGHAEPTGRFAARLERAVAGVTAARPPVTELILIVLAVAVVLGLNLWAIAELLTVGEPPLRRS